MSISISLERPKQHILGGAIAGGVGLASIAASTQLFGGPRFGAGSIAKVALAGAAAGGFAGAMTSVSPVMAGVGLGAVAGMGALAGHLNLGKGIIGRGNVEVATVMAGIGVLSIMAAAGAGAGWKNLQN